jgi:hypothetical protein
LIGPLRRYLSPFADVITVRLNQVIYIEKRFIQLMGLEAGKSEGQLYLRRG